ncbi:uncharacterized protein LOC115954994 [Quercus lobata]|uniref:uncharacterized protein LOC115954994 n=1 Tax=Quercus lobata TaxID=97700 RepID=UPI001246AD73|nr:uncharacterized protein LOC115954994 [Quercus lobata]
MGLNDSYGTLIGQILLIEPFPSLSMVCSLILHEEKRRSIGNIVNVVQQVQQLDPVAMYVNGTRPFQGNQGHVRNNGGKGGNSKKERPVCIYCGFTGHIADKCYKLHEYPPGYKPKGGTKAMANQITGGFGFDGHSNAQYGDVTQPNIGLQTPFGVSQSGFGGFPSGFCFQTCQQTTQPQCPISQVQCEQLLNFLKAHNASGSGFGTPNGLSAQTASQVASVMAPAVPSSTATSTSSSSSNFSGPCSMEHDWSG